ncbi:transcription termination/antitermination NusG family protein [uncultured Devosia sp.]|uniref:transcription termination/antitermination NusG family protein n=1 Tax=uncultured Devosia sp. TaxID=211434 RepID=UPI00262579D2|nr:transcription termination/antitermination NusG family protein [uncultured Devosia sp.]
MFDIQTHIRRAALALRTRAKANELQLDDVTCHTLARAVIGVLPNKQWFAGVTKDQQEWVAASNLREQGFAVYLPKIHMRWQDGRKIEARSILRFTGYIFVAFDLQRDPFGQISNTRGMDDSDGAALLGGDRPTPIPASIIEGLRQAEDEEMARALARKKPKPRADLVPGDQVMIAGDRDNHAFGRKGVYVGSDRGMASVFIGFACWKVPDWTLKKIEQEVKAA